MSTTRKRTKKIAPLTKRMRERADQEDANGGDSELSTLLRESARLVEVLAVEVAVTRYSIRWGGAA